MIEFEVMMRPDRGAGGRWRGKGEPDPPTTEPVEGGRGRPALIFGLLEGTAEQAPTLARSRTLWQGSARLVGPFRPILCDPGMLP